MKSTGAALALCAVGAVAAPIPLTLRSQYMGGMIQGRPGRQEWLEVNNQTAWEASKTGVVVVDMWNKHWCPSATTRVAELAPGINQFVVAARNQGMTVVWAPSDVTGYYANATARKNVLQLPKTAVPQGRPVSEPTLPLNVSLDGGCDVQAKEHRVWTHQIDTLQIHDQDFLISAVEGESEQEFADVIAAKGLTRMVYLGVHLNMCILERPFAIEKLHQWGWTQDRIAVVRELVDVMYSPRSPPYVSHALGLRIHVDYVEKFWANSVSMYDVLAPSYAPSEQ